MAKLVAEKPIAPARTYAPPTETAELVRTIRSQVQVGYLVALLFVAAGTLLFLAGWLACRGSGCVERSPGLSLALLAGLAGLAAPSVWLVGRPIQTSTARPFSWMFSLHYMFVIFTLFPGMGVVIGLGIGVVHGRGRYGSMETRRGEYGPVTASYPAIALEHGEGGPTAVFFVALGLLSSALAVVVFPVPG